MKTQLTFLLIIFSVTISVAQECDCTSNYNWLRETFEKNDAGFQTVINNKGKDAYNFHNKLIEKKIEPITDLHQCIKALRSWMYFFRKGHIDVVNLNTPPNSKEVFLHNTNLNNFKTHLSNKTKQDIEGIWDFDGTEIIFKKVNHQYLGIIHKSNDTIWKKNEVKFILNSNGDGDYFNWEKSKWHVKNTQLLSDDLLRINSNLFLRRIYLHSSENVEKIKTYITTLDSNLPTAYKYNENTYYIRLPSFHHTQKNKIDSIISLFKERISSTENLIIDVRGNTGGSDKSYDKLLPFIYTNPIRKPGFEFLSTELNNQRTLDVINGKFGTLDENEVLYYENRYDILSKNIGEYVNFEHPNKVATITIDTIYEFPKKIAILVDENTISSGEEFVLTAKQSNKVKVYGVTTSGALDAANQYYTFTKGKEVVMVYTLSRRINNLQIDNIGIQPDFYLDKSIPRFEWIEYVAGKL